MSWKWAVEDKCNLHSGWRWYWHLELLKRNFMEPCWFIWKALNCIYISCFYCFIANFYFTAGWELKCWLPFIFFLLKSKSSAAGHGHAHLHVVNQTSKTTAGVCEVSNEDAAGHDGLSVCPTVAFAQGLSVCQGAEWQGRQSSCGWYQACGSWGEAAALSWEWVLQGWVMLTSEARVSQMLWKVSQVCWSSSLSL